MKLYYHPASTTSRPLALFIAESGLKLDMVVVDLFTGEQYKPAFEAINPNHMVPVLDDGDFRLTESSAILKYLADAFNSPLYPKDLKPRARVNERMDWVNTQLNRELCYGVVYPQVFPTHKRPSDLAQQATVEWSRERAQGWLKILNDNIIGANPYLCGDAITIADYYCAPFLAMGEVTGSDFSAYPNIQQWLARMKTLKSWKPVNEVIDGFAASLKDKLLVAA